ncbi:hypothetical protein ACZ87_00525 [Candidatus Erwinia dacicola]|uniref:Uncharacterized protein n=1 Tax=Candidatus Erwinia dacicola TaxID=252393 RepID=A0A328TQW6_9GAMM|nr:hypothetical protein ACZ87_00525 [Candidatus Erwinia dacicola]
MEMFSGDKTYHYHALSHHNKGKPTKIQLNGTKIMVVEIK